MSLQIYREKAKYPAKVFDFFDFTQLDAFHCQEVLSVIYGDDWESILILESDQAFLHTFVKQKIEDTEWYDIEPFLGYSGPVTNTDSIHFIESALKAYSEVCREENIIAEITRFNPLLQNHKRFMNSSLIKVFAAKEIVIINCFDNPDQQIQEFKSPTRRNIKNHAIQSYDFEIYSPPINLEKFCKLYYQFMKDVDAKKEWHFTPDFFQRIKKSSRFKLAEVYEKESICSASIVIEHNLASYYFLSANQLPRLKGSHEFLLLNISIDAAKNGINKLILGGGNTTSPDDSLLVYKKKFSNQSEIFFMGKLVHNAEVFAFLCEEAIKRKPEIADVNFFLKYRL